MSASCTYCRGEHLGIHCFKRHGGRKPHDEPLYTSRGGYAGAWPKRESTPTHADGIAEGRRQAFAEVAAECERRHRGHVAERDHCQSDTQCGACAAYAAQGLEDRYLAAWARQKAGE